MAYLTEPFTYRSGGEIKSLIGPIIDGDGAILCQDKMAGSLVLRCAVSAQTPIKSQLSSPEAGAIWEEYEAHHAKTYAAAEVRRHATRVRSGGQAIFLSPDDGLGVGLTVNDVDSAVVPPSNSVVALVNSLYAGLLKYVTDWSDRPSLSDWLRGNLDANDWIEGDLESVQAPAGLEAYCGTWGYTFWGITAFRNDSRASGTVTGFSATLQAVQRLMRPGYTLILVRSLYSGTSGVLSTTWSAFRVKAAPGNRAAVLTIHMEHREPVGTSSTDNGYAAICGGADFWSTIGQDGQDLPAVTWCKWVYGTGAFTSGIKYIKTQLVPGVYQIREVSRPTGKQFFGTSGSGPVFNNPITAGTKRSADYVFATSSDLKAYGNALPCLTMAQMVEHWVSESVAIPAWIDAWLDQPRVVADQRAWGQAVRKGEPRYYIGKDMTSNKIISVKYRLNGELPAPAPLVEAQRLPLLGSWQSKVKSTDLAAVVSIIETQTGEDLTGLRSELSSVPRIFLGWTGGPMFRVPRDVLYKTSVSAMADEDGADIDDETLFPADADDPESKAVSFGEANRLCNKWYDQGTRKGIAVPGPTVYRPTVRLGGRFDTVQGAIVARYEPTVVDGMTVKGDIMSDADIDSFYNFIKSGGVPSVYAEVAELSAFKEYELSPLPSSVAPVLDYCCLAFFGKKYNAITVAANTGPETAKYWTYQGNRKGTFINDPSTWTPEFWLVTGAGKSYRVESLCGALLLNPFAVGSVNIPALSNQGSSYV